MLPLCSISGGAATTGDGGPARALADAPELSLAYPLAEGAGEGPGEAHQASPRLQTVAHYTAHCRLPYWDTAGDPC